MTSTRYFVLLAAAYVLANIAVLRWGLYGWPL